MWTYIRRPMKKGARVHLLWIAVMLLTGALLFFIAGISRFCPPWVPFFIMLLGLHAATSPHITRRRR